MDDIYPAELEIKDTTNSNPRASYLDLDLSHDRDKRLQVKGNDFNLNIVNFHFLSSNIPLQLMVYMFHNFYGTLVPSLLMIIFWLEVAF